MKQEEQMEDLITEIISSYDKHSDKEISRLDYLPDKNEITEIITMLRKLLFPGYFDENEADASINKRAALKLMVDIEYKLSRQICLVLNLSAAVERNCTCMFEQADEICRAFLSKIPQIIKHLISDVEAAFEGDPAAQNKHEIIFAYPGIGRMMYEAVLQQDINLVLANIMFISFLALVGMALADIILAVVDPRIRYGRQ